MLLTRGVPGTHDINIMIKFFQNLKKKKFKKIKLPTFDKSIDDRRSKKNWFIINKRPDVIILEGWCVGARSENNKSLIKTVNSLEKTSDQNMIWRKFVNQELKATYKKLYSKLDCLLFLKANSFKLLQNWRLQQEAKLKLISKNKKNSKIMSKNEVLTFMQTYQRVTQNMFKYAPKYSSIILNLNSNHQIKSIKYNK